MKLPVFLLCFWSLSADGLAGHRVQAAQAPPKGEAPVRALKATGLHFKTTGELAGEKLGVAFDAAESLKKLLPDDEAKQIAEGIDFETHRVVYFGYHASPTWFAVGGLDQAVVYTVDGATVRFQFKESPVGDETIFHARLFVLPKNVRFEVEADRKRPVRMGKGP